MRALTWQALENAELVIAPENLIAYIREALNLIAEDVRYCEYGW